MYLLQEYRVFSQTREGGVGRENTEERVMKVLVHSHTSDYIIYNATVK